MPSSILENEHQTGWRYREPFTIPLPVTGVLFDATCEVSISLSNKGIEIGEGPDCFISWKDFDAMRKRAETHNRRSWLSLLLLKLAKWTK